MRSKSKREENEKAASPEKAERKIDAPASTKTSRNSVFLFAAALFFAAACLVFIALWVPLGVFGLIPATIFGLLVALSFRIAPQWERVVVLRLGKYHRISGPGFYAVIPFFEHAATHVDQRMRVTSFSAEAALTADLVPIDIDSVLFWMVWNPKDASIEVEDYASAVWWASQTALRDAIGRINLAEVATRREQLDEEVKEILSQKTNSWGITILSVEIRDITIPQELQDAMSREAQAERERNARILLAEVEKDISEMFVDAAAVYEQHDKALQLRTMNLIYESVKEKGGLVIAPSAFGEAFNNIEKFI